MIVIAHVAGVPVEETALALAPTAGLLLLAARSWISRLVQVVRLSLGSSRGSS
jgi:hypothetical protein